MITIEQLANELAKLGYPFAYYQFKKGTNVQFPAIVYFETGSSNYGADNKVYKKVKHYNIELYTEKKEKNIEKQVEDLLDNHSIFYDTDDEFIETENLWQRTYFITLK